MSRDFQTPDKGWLNVGTVEDGVAGRAAHFDAKPGSSAWIDAGACPIDDHHGFTLKVSIRTTEGGFCTPLIARDGESVGLSLIVGREPGKLSFEAWSWQSVKLISRSRVDDGKWHAVKVVYEPTSNHAAMWVDGTMEGCVALGRGGSSTGKLRLGNNVGTDQPFHGDLDELSVVAVAEQAEVFARLAPAVPPEQVQAELRGWRERLNPLATTVPATVEEWGKRKEVIRKGLLDSLGLTPLPTRGDLEVKIYGEAVGSGVRVQRVTFNSWPGYRASAWLWTGDGAEKAGAAASKPERRPAIFMPHGHWAGGAIDPVVQVRAARFARAGYVVLVPDSVHVEDIAAGVSSGGAMAWDNIRALDYLVSRDDVDAARIGITGASGGGQQTMYLMAIEDRLAAAAPVCMITYFNAILDENWSHCGCNHLFAAASVADGPEICAAFAPKPALFICATGDWTAGFPTHGLPEIRALYGLVGASAAVEAEQYNVGHGYDAVMRARAYAFFDGLLKPPHVEASEAGFTSFAASKLLSLGPIPAPPVAETMAAEHLGRRARATLAQVAPAIDWRVRPVALREVGVRGAAADQGAWRACAFTGPDGVSVGLRVKGLDAKNGGPLLLIAGGDAGAALLMNPPEWFAAAKRVAIVESRFGGVASPMAGAWRRNGMLLGCGEGYALARDIAQAAECLPGSDPVTVIALGEAGVPALLASTVSNRLGNIVVQDCGPLFRGHGDRLPQCPEILRVGDLPDLLSRVPRSCRLTVGGAPPDVQHREGFTAAAGPLTLDAIGLAVAAGGG